MASSGTAGGTFTTKAYNAGYMDYISPAKLQSAGALGSSSLVWDELQCSAEPFNSLLQELSLPNGCGITCHDVLSGDAWFVSSLPGPILACIAAVPDGSAAALSRNGNNSSDAAGGDCACTAERSTGAPSDNIWHMQQLVGNACGTIALLHCVMNLPASVITQSAAQSPKPTGASSVFHDWHTRGPATSYQRGAWLEADSRLAAAHAAAAALGSVSHSSLSSEPSGHHFVAYLPSAHACSGQAAYGDACGCTILELDGDLPAPLEHPSLCSGAAADAGGCFLKACIQLAAERRMHTGNAAAADSVAFLVLCTAGRA